MSTTTRVFLFCDGCDEPFDSSTVPSARTVTEAREDAKRCGWVRKRGSRDFCPDCKDQEAAS